MSPCCPRASVPAARAPLTAGTAGAVIAGLATIGGGIFGVGPLLAAAVGGGVMAAYGALLGGIAGSDEPEAHLRALAAEVEAGKILIAVETDNGELETVCEETFAKHGGRQVVA